MPPTSQRDAGNEQAVPMTHASSPPHADVDRHRDDSLRVLHVLAPASVGGLESVVLALTAGHSRAGIDIHVACIVPGRAGDQHPFLETLESAGVPTVRIQVGRRAYFDERGAVRSLCRTLAPSVLHTHGYRPDVIDSSVARVSGIPTVTTVHGFTGGGWRNRLYERLQLRAFRRMSAVVAVSRPLRDQLESLGVPPRSLHLIPNAYQPRRAALSRTQARHALALPTEEPCILGFVGRLSPEKGADIFIDALGQVADLPWTAVILGDGPQMAALQERALSLGIGERVRWAGAVPDAACLYSAFDAFVLSSRTEGTPIALFEAMACGLPIVATRVGGVPDVVTSSEATLVDATAEGVARGIRDTIADRDAARTRGARARAGLASRFAPAPWLEQYARLYRTVAARPSRSQ